MKSLIAACFLFICAASCSADEEAYTLKEIRFGASPQALADETGLIAPEKIEKRRRLADYEYGCYEFTVAGVHPRNFHGYFVNVGNALRLYKFEMVFEREDNDKVKAALIEKYGKPKTKRDLRLNPIHRWENGRSKLEWAPYFYSYQGQLTDSYKPYLPIVEQAQKHDF